MKRVANECPYCGHPVVARKTKNDLYCTDCMVSWADEAALRKDARETNTQPDVIYRQSPEEIEPRWN